LDVEGKGGQRFAKVLCLLQLNGVSYGALGSMKVVIKFCFDVFDTNPPKIVKFMAK